MEPVAAAPALAGAGQRPPPRPVRSAVRPAVPRAGRRRKASPPPAALLAQGDDPLEPPLACGPVSSSRGLAPPARGTTPAPLACGPVPSSRGLAPPARGTTPAP